MPRVLKPQEVMQARDPKTGVTVSIYFDRNLHDFFGKVGEDIIRHPEADKCKRAVYEALAKFRPYTWKQYIFIEGMKDERVFGGGYNACRFRARVELVFWRTEMAQKDDGHWLERPFLVDGLDDEDRKPRDGDTRSKTRLAEDRDGQRLQNLECRERGEDIRESGYGKDICSDCYTWLPYSASAWFALHGLASHIQIAEVQLDSIVRSKDLETKLVLVASTLKFLPEKT
jgi:hypothetical protein